MKSKITSRLPLRSHVSPAFGPRSSHCELIELERRRLWFPPTNPNVPRAFGPISRCRGDAGAFPAFPREGDIPGGRPGNEVRRDGETRALRMMCGPSLAALLVPASLPRGCCHGRRRMCGVTPALQMAGGRERWRKRAGPFPTRPIPPGKGHKL